MDKNDKESLTTIISNDIFVPYPNNFCRIFATSFEFSFNCDICLHFCGSKSNRTLYAKILCFSYSIHGGVNKNGIGGLKDFAKLIRTPGT